MSDTIPRHINLCLGRRQAVTSVRHGSRGTISTGTRGPAIDIPEEASITNKIRPVCDCAEPCGCYAEGHAAGKDNAYIKVLDSLDGAPHAEDCACRPAKSKPPVSGR